MATTEHVSIATGDGEMPAHLAVPEGGRGPGVVLFQELLGVNDYVRDVADRLADAGFVTVAPVLYWRLDGTIEFNREEEFGEAFGLAARFDLDAAMGDAAATLAWLRARPEVDGGVGGLGFCMGGGLVFQFAATTDPDCAVSYYGPQVAGLLDQADRVRCPVQFHFGRTDSFVPLEGVDAVKAAFAGRDDVEVHLYDAGHAFDNHHAPSMHDPAAAAEAWDRALDFLHRHLHQNGAAR